jgi:hypothetical protein
MHHTILLITSAAGGGHLQAARVKAAEYRDATITTFDILPGSLGPLGSLCARLWNRAQERGNYRKQQWLARRQPLADRLFWLPIYIATLIRLLRHNADLIIDTQPVGTSAIIAAARCAMRWQRRQILIRKVLTELPSCEIPHYLAPMRRLSSKARRLIQLETLPPLPDDAATWEEEYGITARNLVLRAPLLRETFREILDTLPTISELTIETEAGKRTIAIPDRARVTTIMLGSHQPEQATIAYVKRFIEAKCDTTDDLLFVVATYDSLYNAIAALDSAPHLEIIPLTFQEEGVIAPLLYRSDATLTKAGGLTAMELLAIARGEIWIHSESPPDEEPLDGMPIWEAGNARYLMRAKGAHCVTPQTCHEPLRTFLTRKRGEEVPRSSLAPAGRAL